MSVSSPGHGLMFSNGWQRLMTPLFPAPVTFIEVSVNLLRDKVGLDVFEQVALIAFEGTEIVIASINNQLTGFFGC